MAIVFKQPRALGTYRAMILELSLSTWACVGATIIIGALVFAMTQKYEPDPEASFDADGSFGLAIVQSLGIIANQGEVDLKLRRMLNLCSGKRRNSINNWFFRVVRYS